MFVLGAFLRPVAKHIGLLARSQFRHEILKTITGSRRRANMVKRVLIACSAPGPAPRDGVLLTEAGLVLESDLYGRALREACPELCHFGSKPLFE